MFLILCSRCIPFRIGTSASVLSRNTVIGLTFYCARLIRMRFKSQYHHIKADRNMNWAPIWCWVLDATSNGMNILCYVRILVCFSGWYIFSLYWKLSYTASTASLGIRNISINAIIGTIHMHDLFYLWPTLCCVHRFVGETISYSDC